MDTEQLIEDRNKLLNELNKFCCEQPIIKAFFLGGSLAEESADAYSDIDFRLVLADSASKSAVLSTINAHFYDQIVFIETSASFYRVLHFKNFVKLDLFAYHDKDLKPSIWLKDILILKDHYHLLADLKSSSAKEKYIVKQEKIIDYLSKYTAYLHELYRRKHRNESNYCEYCTLMMKHILVSLWLIAQGDIPNELGDWSKYEGARSKLDSRRQEFLAKFTPTDFTDLGAFVREMNREVLCISNQISQRETLEIELLPYDTLFSVIEF